MPLDVNSYNAQFQHFVDFATNALQVDPQKAGEHIARADGTTDLGHRSITANNNDVAGKWGPRSQEAKDANNLARDLFKKAVSDMFGGENRIPESVRQAMKLEDYGQGKPLTVRRILAVKVAIDLDATLNVFQDPKAKETAQALGWKASELPDLARAAHFLCQAKHMTDETTAILELSNPASDAHRLMNYGGRFMDSAANFRNGLRLMEGFANWYKDMVDTMTPVYAQPRAQRDYGPADTFTKLNFDLGMLTGDNLKGFEKFAFEELAVNPKANLAETDMEKLFGFENNRAMNFFGHEFGESSYSTMANIPPDKRSVVYAALNAFTQPAHNAQEAHDKNLGSGVYTWLSSSHAPKIIARILQNYDQAEALYRANKLTPKNIINNFFPEIRDKGDYDYQTLKDHFDPIGIELMRTKEEGGQYTDLDPTSLQMAMNNSGYSLEETANILRQGQVPQPAPYMCSGTLGLSDVNGDTEVGLRLLNTDLGRPDCSYRFSNDKDRPLLDPAQHGRFGFTFPDGEHCFTNGTVEGKANIQRVGDKVLEMCGTAHANQANNVMMMLSQSGLSPLLGGIPGVNATSNEHAPVEFTLSQNEQTGAVTIDYNSPEALPFKFHWKATVDVNGHITTTPLEVARKSLPQEQVNAALDAAVQRTGVDLNNPAKRAIAEKLIGELALSYDLKDNKLALFANYVVHQELRAETVEEDTRLAIDMAKNISKWTEFAVGRGEAAGVGDVEAAFKQRLNDILSWTEAEAAKKDSSYFPQGSSISDSMVKDAGRSTYIFNGRQMPEDAAEAVLTEFQKQVPNANMQRGLSSLMSQLTPMIFVAMANRSALDDLKVDGHTYTGIQTADIKGIENMVSRDHEKGGYMFPTVRQPKSFSYDLQMGENGKATLTIKAQCPLLAAFNKNYGTVDYTCQVALDLSGQQPKIEGVQLGQSFAAA